MMYTSLELYSSAERGWGKIPGPHVWLPPRRRAVPLEDGPN